MRRLAALIVLPFLAIAAGCSSSDDTSTTSGGATPVVGDGASSTPVDPSAAAAGDKALTGNTKAICDQAGRASTSFGQTFIADLKLQIDAAAKDAAAKSEAQQKIDRDVENYSVALSQMAGLADDKALKSALTQMSKQVKALKGDVTKLNADKMSELTTTLDKACGKS
ncbi:hypothetical protein [Actinoplanes sp. NPDC026619]|uniref:hypothetical protein n=1 Tax=Actinoplanes sp. NPDC026619 TaxID=3155798 RepID=UPI0033C5DCA5